MKLKHIAALLTFLLTFGMTTALLGLVGIKHVSRTTNVQPQSESQRQMLNFLQQDISNGQRRFAKIARYNDDETLKNEAAAVSDYSNESGSMNDENLPADLQAAWRKHQQAWRVHAEYLQEQAKLKDVDEDELEARWQEQSDEINRTWFTVLKIAGKYGVYPDHAY